MISDDEIKDCVWRHEHFLELKLRHPKIIHRPGCTRGKRMWRFCWKWPFVRTWISQAICMCEIIQIEELVATFEQVIPILKGAGYDMTPLVVADLKSSALTNVSLMEPEERLKIVNRLRKALAENTKIDAVRR
jgi:hypothetical protein